MITNGVSRLYAYIAIKSISHSSMFDHIYARGQVGIKVSVYVLQSIYNIFAQ